MESLLVKLLDASGVSGYETDVAALMSEAFKPHCDEVSVDTFGNVIARKGNGPVKIMLAAHMDEVGLVVKHIAKDGFLSFIKVGGIDDRILAGQRVLVCAKNGPVTGIIGTKPPHLQKDEERKNALKYEDMYIDIGCRSKEEADHKVQIGDPVVFASPCGTLSDSLWYGKALDDRLGCYALVKILESVAASGASVYAVATTQEEVGLKGARTSSFRINPDFALVLDTTVSGDTPQLKDRESVLKLGEGVAITLIEASGRGLIVSPKIRQLLISTATERQIKFQLDVVEGGMTDGAMIYLSREGVPTGVLSIPSRYIHSPSGVFHRDDLAAAIQLATHVLTRVAADPACLR